MRPLSLFENSKIQILNNFIIKEENGVEHTLRSESSFTLYYPGIHKINVRLKYRVRNSALSCFSESGFLNLLK